MATTFAAIARRLNCDESSVRAWVAGRTRPSLQRRLQLERVYGIPAEAWDVPWPGSQQQSLGDVEESALEKVTRHQAESGEVSPVFRSMPIEELRAYVSLKESEAAGRPVDRDVRAHVHGTVLLRFLEGADDHQKLLAIEAIERAWKHFRPPPCAGTALEDEAGKTIEHRYARRVVEHLDWAKRRVTWGEPVDLVATALAEMEVNIPVSRWREALAHWKGQLRGPRGRPRKGSERYAWHEVLYRLLTGKDDDVAAKNLGDGLTADRRARRQMR